MENLFIFNRYGGSFVKNYVLFICFFFNWMFSFYYPFLLNKSYGPEYNKSSNSKCADIICQTM